MFSALLKKLTAESIIFFMRSKQKPTPTQLLDEIQRRGEIFCKKEDVNFNDTFAWVQLQSLRKEVIRASAKKIVVSSQKQL